MESAPSHLSPEGNQSSDTELAARVMTLLLSTDGDVFDIGSFVGNVVEHSYGELDSLDPRAFLDALNILEEAGYVRIDNTLGKMTINRTTMADDLNFA